jgi:hypothetical protein
MAYIFHFILDKKQCSAVKPELRSDCGWGGINKKDCERIGCCHDDTIADTFYCYCPASKLSFSI